MAFWSDLLGTTASYFKLGKGGVRLTPQSGQGLGILGSDGTQYTHLRCHTVGLADVGQAQQLTLHCNEDLSADRTLIILTGDADRTLTFTGNASISGTHSGTSSGTNTGDALFDGLSAPAQADVSVTGAVTLNSSARGRMHAVTGSSDYTITLVAASTAGFKIGFSFRQNAGVLVRLTGVAMGGLSDMYFITGESLVLRSNGTTYDIESYGERRPWFKATRTSNLNLTSGVWSTAQYNVDTNADPYSLYDTSTYVFTANRPGRWEIVHRVLGGPDSAGLTVVGGGIRVNTTSGTPAIADNIDWSTTTSRRIRSIEDAVLAKGNTRQPACYVAHSGTTPVLDFNESYFLARWLGHE